MRWRAAEAFGKIGAEAVEPRMEPLIEALTDERLFVRASAAQALGILGSAKAIEPLTKALQNEKNPFVRGIVKETLDKITAKQKLKSSVKRGA